jgi:hypothetical protein
VGTCSTAPWGRLFDQGNLAALGRSDRQRGMFAEVYNTTTYYSQQAPIPDLSAYRSRRRGLERRQADQGHPAQTDRPHGLRKTARSLISRIMDSTYSGK